MYRDHNCGELNIKNVNEKVMLVGYKELEILEKLNLLIYVMKKE